MGKGTLRIYLVRHGVTVWNSEARLQGHTDIALNAEGEEQARRLSARLANQKIDAIWSSDLSRALGTAEIIAEPHGLRVTATNQLRESMLGAWEGLTEAEILAQGYEEQWQEYRRDSLKTRPPGGEQLHDVWMRLLAILKVIREAHPDGTVVVVGHGGSLRAILCDALQAPIESMRRIWLDNASLSIVEYSNERSWVKLVNDTSHLDGGAPCRIGL